MAVKAAMLILWLCVANAAEDQVEAELAMAQSLEAVDQKLPLLSTPPMDLERKLVHKESAPPTPQPSRGILLKHSRKKQEQHLEKEDQKEGMFSDLKDWGLKKMGYETTEKWWEGPSTEEHPFDRNLVCGQLKGQHCGECHYTLAYAAGDLDSTSFFGGHKDTRGTSEDLKKSKALNIIKDTKNEAGQQWKTATGNSKENLAFIKSHVSKLRSEFIQDLSGKQQMVQQGPAEIQPQGHWVFIDDSQGNKEPTTFGGGIEGTPAYSPVSSPVADPTSQLVSAIPANLRQSQTEQSAMTLERNKKEKAEHQDNEELADCLICKSLQCCGAHGLEGNGQKLGKMMTNSGFSRKTVLQCSKKYTHLKLGITPPAEDEDAPKPKKKEAEKEPIDEFQFKTDQLMEDKRLSIDGYSFQMGDCAGDGMNIGKPTHETLESCSAKCSGDQDCMAFSFAGDVDEGGACAMKKAISCTSPDATVDSYFFTKENLGSGKGLSENAGKESGIKDDTEATSALTPPVVHHKLKREALKDADYVVVDDPSKVQIGQELTFDAKDGPRAESTVATRVGEVAGETVIYLKAPLQHNHKKGSDCQAVLELPPSKSSRKKTEVDVTAESCGGKGCGKGVCVAGSCYCSAGWTGPECQNAIQASGIDDSQESCPEGGCGNGGVCMNSKCMCPDGFTGPNCEMSMEEAARVAEAMAAKSLVEKSAEQVMDEIAGEGDHCKGDGSLARPLGAYGEGIEPGYVDALVKSQTIGEKPKQKKWDGLSLSNFIAQMGGIKGLRGNTWNRHRPYEGATFRQPIPELHSKYGKRGTFLNVEDTSK